MKDVNVNNLDSQIPYSGFFEGENFHVFHKSLAICENFTLEIFPLQTL